jgi:hypothetical protein
MRQTESDTALLDVCEEDLERPHGMRVLTAFEDIYDLLEGLESVGNGISREALKKGKFEVSFHSNEYPYSKQERARSTTPIPRYKVNIKTEKFPARFFPFYVSHPGSWEGVEHDIKEDIACLKSMGIPNIEYVGYKGGLP